MELRISKIGGQTKPPHPDIQTILDRYSVVFGDIPLGQPLDRGFKHTIELEPGVQAVITTPYRHPKAYNDEIERAINEFLSLGHIRPSFSPFASSIVVEKKHWNLRMCIDYRALNKKTMKNRYLFPRIDELMDKLRGAKYFSNINLRSGYHQIRVRDQDIPKTTFRCHYGHFEFLIMPFGLKNAAAIFQSCMKRVFCGQLRKFVLVFFDDILIYNRRWEEHLQHLEVVLRILEEYQFYAKLSKCEFGLIGICTYYRKFVKGFSHLVASLTNLTKKRDFTWIDRAQSTFDHLKEVMASCQVLALPDFTQPFTLACNALGKGVGAILSEDGHSIAFESRKLLPHERLYSIYDKEMLAIMHVLAKFHQYLVGTNFA